MSTRALLTRFVATLFVAAPRKAAASAVVMIALSFTEGLGLLLLVPLLQLVGVDNETATGAQWSGRLAAVFSSFGLQPTLPSVLVLYVGVVVCQGTLQRWHIMLSAAVRQQTEAMLRMRLYRAIAGAQWLFIARSRLSDFGQMLTQELDRIGVATHDFIDMSVTTVVVIVYIGIAISVSPATTVLVLASGGALAWVLRGRVRASHEIGGQMASIRARLNAAVTEHLGSLKTAKSFGSLDRHDQIFDSLTDEVRAANLRTVAGYARLRQETVVGSAVVLAVIVYTARAVLTLPTAHLLMMLFLFARLMPRLTGLVERAQTFATVLPSFAVFHDAETRCLAAAEPGVSRAQPITFDREIRLERVSFSYVADSSIPAVRDLDLVIKAASTTAIVGPSGAGKSTIADLLLGLITPTAGAIFVDGQMLGPDQLSAWRDRIGYVTQDTFLFHDSVRANLRWARANASDEDVAEVLRLAAADDFVARLPQGLDTVIGDRGVLVSGGERQRLALARALLRRPTVLILDEATSALDSENETRIQQAIERLTHRMTILVITHRLATVRTADVIHVIDEGRLVESGSWTDLVTRPQSRFRQLCQAQGVQPTTGPVAIRELNVVGH